MCAGKRDSHTGISISPAIYRRSSERWGFEKLLQNHDPELIRKVRGSYVNRSPEVDEYAKCWELRPKRGLGMTARTV